MADWPTPPKYLQAISETRSNIGDRGKPTYDDTYGMSPVSYVKLDRLPSVDDMSPIINAMKRGDYFVTSGEVLNLLLCRRRHRRSANDHGGGRVDLPVGLRRGGVGRRAHHRSADHLDDRPACVRQEALPDSVQCSGQEMGAIRRLGRGDQRSVRSTHQAADSDDFVGRSLNAPAVPPRRRCGDRRSNHPIPVGSRIP